MDQLGAVETLSGDLMPLSISSLTCEIGERDRKTKRREKGNYRVKRKERGGHFTECRGKGESFGTHGIGMKSKGIL